MVYYCYTNITSSLQELERSIEIALKYQQTWRNLRAKWVVALGKTKSPYFSWWSLVIISHRSAVPPSWAFRRIWPSGVCPRPHPHFELISGSCGFVSIEPEMESWANRHGEQPGIGTSRMDVWLHDPLGCTEQKMPTFIPKSVWLDPTRPRDDLSWCSANLFQCLLLHKPSINLSTTNVWSLKNCDFP